MPTKSPAQHRLMEAVAHNPKFAKKVGIPQSVGKEMVAHDSCPIKAHLDAARRGDAIGMSRLGKIK